MMTDLLRRRDLKIVIYSKTCEYAIRALVYLAGKEKGAFTMVSEISEETGVPGPYIAKIFQNLVKKEILKSLRGPSGGFAFKDNPEELSLKQVVMAIDDFSQLDQCIMGLDSCSNDNPCPLHEVWSEAKEKINQHLERCRLTQLTKDVGKLKYRELNRARLNSELDLNRNNPPSVPKKVPAAEKK